jgi:hypothetical protein
MIAARAALWVLLAWGVSALIAFWIHSIADRRTLSSGVFESSARAMWFAPAIILLSTMSAAGLCIGFLLTVHTAKVLTVQWTRPGPRQQADGWNPMPSFGAALLLQAGGIALLWKRPVLAGAAFVVSCAMITTLGVLRAPMAPSKTRPLPPSSHGMLLTFLLAAMISTLGLQFREFASQGGDSDLNGTAASRSTATELVPGEPEATGTGTDGFPGVILRIAKPDATRIAAPISRSLVAKNNSITEPLRIAFSGEYWLFQPPRMRPPAGAIIRKGTPLELSFHTTNGSTMFMEAHQRLNPPIPLSSCGRLDVEVRSAEKEQLLRLNVSLLDSASRRTLDLGTAQASSSQTQTLEYEIPSAARPESFDEIRLVYRSLHMERSTHLAIEGFVLMPR